MKNPMEGVGTHPDISPKDNEFMIKVRELVDSDPDLLGNSDIMKLVKVALFRAGKNEPVHEIANELDDGLRSKNLKKYCFSFFKDYNFLKS